MKIGRPLKRSGRHENRQGGVYKKISRDSNYISIYFYLKSHEILTIFRSKETLTILGRVLFIEKATRMMKLKTLRNRGWGTKRVYPLACWVKKCSSRGWCRMSDYGWHWLMWTVITLSFSENTAGWFYNQHNYCCHVSTPIYYTPLLRCNKHNIIYVCQLPLTSGGHHPLGHLVKTSYVD